MPVSCGYEWLILFCNFISPVIVRVTGFKSKHVYFWPQMKIHSTAIFIFFTIGNNMSDMQNIEMGEVLQDFSVKTYCLWKTHYFRKTQTIALAWESPHRLSLSHFWRHTSQYNVSVNKTMNKLTREGIFFCMDTPVSTKVIIFLLCRVQEEWPSMS